MAKGITKSAYKVLELLKNNQNGYMTPSEVGYALNKKAASVSNILVRLKNKGYIDLLNDGIIHNYTLTNKGNEILNGYLKRVIAQSNKPNLNLEALYTRLHALTISIPLRNLLSQPDISKLVASYSPKPLKLKNHIDYVFVFKDYTFKLTSKSLIVYAKQAIARLDTEIPDLTDQAIHDTLNVVYDLEQALHAQNAYFSLQRNTKTINNQKDYYCILVELHIAITNDLFAKEATKISDPYIIAMSEVSSKKIGILGDKSKKIGSGYKQQGIPEVEGVSHATLPDGKIEAVKNMENIRRLYELVGQGKFVPEQEQQLLREMMGMLQQSITTQSNIAQSQAEITQNTAQLSNAALTTQNQLNYYAAQIEAHAKAIVKLNKVLDKLDRLLSQRKLKEY